MYKQDMSAATKERNTGYILHYTNESGSECERELEAMTDAQAITFAAAMCQGNEGLWSGITLEREDGEELDFKPF